MLPPNTFRPGPAVSAAVASGCPVAAVNAAGSNLYADAGWDRGGGDPGPPGSDQICPYASFGGGVSGEPQVTLKLHPTDFAFGPLCEPTGFAFTSLDDSHLVTPVTTTFAAHDTHPCEPVYATLLHRSRTSASREELTDASGKKLISLNVVDTKYDSDSDFDYRKRPPRWVELISFTFLLVTLDFFQAPLSTQA